jgi:oxygen-independent coproporphyrinogen-3 oxidase
MDTRLARTGVYLHFPFCAARCSYCDFASVAGRDDLIERYVVALEDEIRRFGPEAPVPADTLYIGGGTPSRMSAEQLRRVIRAAIERFDFVPAPEISVEGNPESLSHEALAGFLEAGVDRVCVGVQSLDDRVLEGVGRLHDARGAKEAVSRARDAGFRSVGLDLIAGLPGEDLESWPRTVDEAAALGPDHVSVYLLETDKDTPLTRAVREGRAAVADDDALAAAYEAGTEVLLSAGFEAYEISNFARPGHECRHNLKYWTDAPYAGFGLGAHAYQGGERRANVRDLEGYLAKVEAGEDPVATLEPFEAGRRAAEALILGLRLAEGVDVEEVGRRYGIDLEAGHREAWERGRASGLVERVGSRARLTRWGRVRCNDLFAELI